MIWSLIVTAALAGQAPPPRPAPRPAATRPVNRARAKRAAADARALRAEAAEAAQQRTMAAARQEQYEKMLPYMLEQQRQMLDYDVRMRQAQAMEQQAAATRSVANSISTAAWYNRQWRP